MKKSLLGALFLAALGAALAYVPMDYYTEGILMLLCINMIAAMGVSLLTGFTGIFTLGHAAYMAMGAYTAAILIMNYDVPWLPSVLAGGVLAAALAWVVGVPTMKLTGDYYAIASLGLCEAIRLVIENWQSVTPAQAQIREQLLRLKWKNYSHAHTTEQKLISNIVLSKKVALANA